MVFGLPLSLWGRNFRLERAERGKRKERYLWEMPHSCGQALFGPITRALLGGHDRREFVHYFKFYFYALFFFCRLLFLFPSVSAVSWGAVTLVRGLNLSPHRFFEFSVSCFFLVRDGKRIGRRDETDSLAGPAVCLKDLSIEISWSLNCLVPWSRWLWLRFFFTRVFVGQF